MAAEVINLSRNVKVDGDNDNYEQTHHGWHTMAWAGGERFVFNNGWNSVQLLFSRTKNCNRR